MELLINVLFVEDSEDDAMLATRALQRGGFAPTTKRVQCATELREALDSGSWDAVISDYRLPGFTGLEALQIVRGAGLDIPFILSSGAIGEETAAAAMKAGANDYVMKQNLARLAPALQRELREAGMRVAHWQAQAEIQASEERYRLLFHGNPLPLWVYDPQTMTFLDVNEVACSKYGYSHEEFLAMTPRDIRPAEDLPAFDSYVAAGSFGQGRVWRHRLKDGTVIDVEIYSHGIVYCGRNARFVTAIDVTERVRAEKHLRLLSLAVRQSPAATLITDIDGRIEYANPKFCAASGYSEGELIGKTPAVVKSGLTAPEVYRDLWTMIKSGVSWRGVLRNRRKNGELYWEDSEISPLVDDAGRIVKFVAVKEDITLRRQAEEKLQRLNAELERRVEERTHELRAANQELEAFAHSVSHDLRAPLVTMRKFADALLADCTGGLDEAGCRYVERIQSGAQRMEKLIDDLLELSHISRSELAQDEVCLSTLAQEALSELREKEPNRHCKLAVDPGLRALGDANLLRIALTNLLANAWKFSSRRDVVIIEVGELASSGPQATFYVRDRGAGFDPGQADKLFGAFQRLHSASEFPGTGIGLAIVRRVIERHGGAVRAEGAPDRGATFWFSLPRPARGIARAQV